MNNGMTIARARHALVHMRTIELFVSGIGNQMSRQIKTADSYADDRPFIRRGIERVTSHHKFSRWDEEHLGAERILEINIASALRGNIDFDRNCVGGSPDMRFLRCRSRRSIACRSQSRLRLRNGVRFFQIKIDKILGFPRLDAEAFRHVDESVALIVGHAEAVERTQPQHAQKFLLRIG